MATLHGPRKDPQTVTPEGQRVGALIAGVRLRPAVTVPDDRGRLCEIYNPAWGFSDEPMVYAYMATLRPGVAKGWVVHYEQNDRIFVIQGTIMFVLYDAREDSPTQGMVGEHTIGVENRQLLLIPHGVFHTLVNVGEEEAVFVNLPSQPYRHDDPDKYRLPLDTEEIPYRIPSHYHGY